MGLAIAGSLWLWICVCTAGSRGPTDVFCEGFHDFGHPFLAHDEPSHTLGLDVDDFGLARFFRAQHRWEGGVEADHVLASKELRGDVVRVDRHHVRGRWETDVHIDPAFTFAHDSRLSRPAVGTAFAAA